MSDLLTRAKEIKNATEIGENTAERVGGVMVDTINAITSLQERAVLHEDSLTTHGKQIAALQTKVQDVIYTNQDQQEAINAQAAGLTEAERRIQEHTTQVNSHEERLTEVERVGAALLPYLEELCAYGVQFDTSVSSPSCTRIGNTDLHKSLPIHNRMKGCLLADDGSVTEYLNPASWEGQPRDGSRGQVMVELPAHYRKFETEGTIRRVKISELPLPGYHLVPKQYVSAYEATVQRSTTKLCSVANSDADYRGGNNTSSYDGTYRSLLGRPATSISRTNFRAYARKRNTTTTEWNCMTYDIQKELYWLFVIEYATLNSQADYNAAKDANGYMQGGLGDGVTTLSGWGEFNGYNPIIPCGHTDSLGNASGIVAYTVKDSANADLKTFNVPRYRGVENPFGHIWQWTDGVNVRISPTSANGGDDLSKTFICSDPALFTDSSYNGYSHVGNEARAEGYAKSHIFGEYGEIIPDAVGGGSTTYMCDYHYTNIPTSEALRGVLFGGSAHSGAYAGFGSASSYNAPSYTYAYLGSRLCFIPAN